MVSWFEEQAAQTPDHVALTGVGTTLTYRELAERSERLAAHLQLRGVAPDVRVGLFLERTTDLVVAILAILKAGGAYVPIDPFYPPERISFLVHDAALSVLVTQSGLESRLPPHRARLVRVDEVARAEPLTAVARAPAQPDNLAYIIYTSGSTGRPKGVEITHRNVVSLFESAAEKFQFRSSDVWTLFHSCAFDFSVWEIWGALLHGGRLVIVPHGVSRSPSDFLELLGREKVTVLNQTPSAFRQLQEAEQDAPRPDLALRYVIFGGEALDPRMLRPWVHSHGDERPRLVNLYGITETTVHVTHRVLRREDTERGDSVIGAPLAHLTLHLLDADLRPVARGEIGEIFVGGSGLARGYHKRPELTAERFIANPLRPGQRLYRTGDLARQLENGEFEYLGRSDEQVKIRGHRIELGEIEAALADLPGIRSAVVAVRESHDGDRRLVAYFTAQAGVPLAPAVLREKLSARLPDYMLPAAFIPLERLPLTAHGKIDRNALPATGELVAHAPESRPAETPIESQLAAIWTELLGATPSAHDDFFALGGHSLLATRVLNRVRERFGVELPIGALFASPTLAALAREIEARIETRPTTPESDAEDRPLVATK